jgi:hypothetical protein
MLETQKNIPTVPSVPQKHRHLLKEIAWPFQLAMFLSKKLTVCSGEKTNHHET